MASGVATVWVPVSDMDRAVTFYTDVLGLDLADRQGDEWAEVDAGGLKIGLNGREPGGQGGGAGGGAVISFQPDDDLEGEVEALRGQGVQFTGDISEHPWGRIAPFQDSEGNALQFYAPPKS